MEDLRKKDLQRKINNFQKINNIIIFLKKNWINILIVLFILFVLFFPNLLGNFIGNWYDKFTHSIINNLTS